MALSKSFAINEILTADDVNTHLVNRVPAPGAPFDTGWVTITIASGITLNTPFQVRRVGLTMWTRGQINSGTTANTTTALATLPTAYRPASAVRVPVAGVNPAHNATLMINSNGLVQLRTGAAVGTLSLDSSYLKV